MFNTRTVLVGSTVVDSDSRRWEVVAKITTSEDTDKIRLVLLSENLHISDEFTTLGFGKTSQIQLVYTEVGGMDERLKKIGVEESYSGIASKVNRGTFSFLFFAQCMHAIGKTIVHIDPKGVK